METTMLLVVGGCFVATWAIWLWLKEPHKPNERYGAERDLSAEVEVEETDIEQMINARNERRKRLGKPEIGEDLVRQLRAEIARTGGLAPADPSEPTPPRNPPRPPAEPSR